MRILQVCTYEDGGGAPRAASRLNRALMEAGCDSRMYVLSRNVGRPETIQYQPPRRLIHGILERIRRRQLSRDLGRYRITGGWMYDDDRSPYGSDPSDQLPECDLIHVHWLAGFLDQRAFFRRCGGRRPIVWTLHDMSAFTGGCYFDGGCGKFREHCGACPRLGSSDPHDLSAHVWTRKHASLRGLPDEALNIVALSRWMEQEVRSSALLGRFPVTRIPNGLDPDLYRPTDKAIARTALRLPAEARIVLFLAHGVHLERKGMHLLLPALERLRHIPNLLMVSVGAGRMDFPAGIQGRHLGTIDNELMLSLVYSAADVFALPSLQDNLPNVMLEALACGVPVVAFGCGGIVDVIRPGENGFTVPVGDIEALARALERFLIDDEYQRCAGVAARQTVLENYTLRHQAERHLDLYRQLLSCPQATAAERTRQMQPV